MLWALYEWMAMPLTRIPTLVRSCAGRLLGVTVALSLLFTSAAHFAPPAHADPTVTVSSGSFVIRGSGYGHGWGMSQYGAYGAARKGLNWKQIVGFYYPGTQRTTMPSGTTIKVWVTADNDNSLWLSPAPGLRITDASGRSFTLPTGSAYRSWRVSRSGDGYRLTYRNPSGADIAVATKLATTTWTVHNSAKLIKLGMPDHSVREYRGSVQLVKRGSGARTVNQVTLEDYVKAVVPAEMPTSWASDAVSAQAVAARSYAVRIRDFTDYSGYDVCDTTTCQVYGGYARTSSGGNRTVLETKGGNDATKATAGVILTYGGKVALTQFGSSNGGHSAQGDYAYLTPRADPYDGVIRSQAWTKTIKASSIAAAWPSVGTVQRLQITQRDGDGGWGGRVTSITIIGSKTSIAVSGKTFQYRFGMRSSLFTAAP